MNLNDWLVYDKKEPLKEPHQESEAKMLQLPQDFDLAYVVEHYPAALESRAKLAATLHDLYPTEKIKTNLALAAYGCGVVSRISSAESLSPQMVGSFVRQMQCDYGVTEENAVLSVKLWAIAYHIEMPHQEVRVETANVIPVKQEPRPASNVSLASTQAVPTEPVNGEPSEFSIELLKDGTVAIKEYLGFDKPIITIPNVIDGKRVSCIGKSAFKECDFITGLVLSDGIQSIDAEAFLGCKNLMQVRFSRTLKYVGESAFSNTGLTDIIFPASIRKIEDNAFSFCKSLTKVTFDDGLTLIPTGCFRNCESLSEVKLPSTLRTILSSAFSRCYSLQEIIFPPQLQTIWYFAFEFSGLRHVKLNNGLEKIESYAFSHCQKLSYIEFPNSVTDIGDYVFQNSGLETIKLNEGLKTIGTRAFMSCAGQRAFLVPSTVESIGDSAFGAPCFHDSLSGKDIRITLYCHLGSKALQYARKHGYAVKNAADWPN